MRVNQHSTFGLDRAGQSQRPVLPVIDRLWQVNRQEVEVKYLPIEIVQFTSPLGRFPRSVDQGSVIVCVDHSQSAGVLNDLVQSFSLGTFPHHNDSCFRVKLEGEEPDTGASEGARDIFWTPPARVISAIRNHVHSVAHTHVGGSEEIDALVNSIPERRWPLKVLTAAKCCQFVHELLVVSGRE